MNLQNFAENVQLWGNVFMGTACMADRMPHPFHGYVSCWHKG